MMDGGKVWAVIFLVLCGILVLAICCVGIREMIKKARKVGVVKTLADFCMGLAIVSMVICFLIGMVTPSRISRPQQDAVYENADGSLSPKHITIYPGETVDIVFFRGSSIEGKWSSEGFGLYLDGYDNAKGLPVAERRNRNWNDRIQTNLYDILDDFVLKGSITLPESGFEPPLSLTGTISGIITYPSLYNNNQVFTDTTMEINVPVIIDLLPVDEEYLHIAERVKNNNKALAALWISFAVMLVSLVVSKKAGPKKQKEEEKQENVQG